MNKFTQKSKNILPKSSNLKLAGMAFTLFMCEPTNAGTQSLVSKFEIYQSEKENKQPYLGNNTCFKFSINESTTLEKSYDAYSRFAIKHNNDSLKPIFDLISKGLKDIKADRVAINGNFNIGSLNILYKLPDGIILSVNKRLETLEDQYVGFSLTEDRNLLFSDINTIENLSNYIKSVQAKLI